jgi:hypothetical protein
MQIPFWPLRLPFLLMLEVKKAVDHFEFPFTDFWIIRSLMEISASDGKTGDRRIVLQSET